jgi:hypothetical protein
VVEADFDSFGDMWMAVCDRYPAFRDPDHVLQQTSRGLKRLLEQAWKSAESRGHSVGRAMKRLSELQRGNKKSRTESFLDEFMRGSFGT